MSELERVLEKLRPFVGKNGWEYCVVWKLGDYSTRLRFIEMIGCCCCGGVEETQHNGLDNSLQLCRDIVCPHPMRTKACNALANLPASIPLSFGVYVEVLVSGQPRWISPDVSMLTKEMNGTRVLIPVLGGLIELFAAIQIPQEYPMMELILTYCNDEKEAKILSMDKHLNAACLEDGNEFLSTDPFPLADHHSFGSNLVCGARQLIGPDYSVCTQSKSKNVARQKRKLVSHTSNNKEGYLTDLKKQDGNAQKSRNLVIERNRRKKLKALILTLRSLVPNITKMDIQATLGDASSYIVELLKKVETLEDELKQMETEDANENTESENQKLASRKPDNHVTSQQSRSEISTDQSEYNHDGLIVSNLEEEIEETVEVSECGKKEFFVKLIIQKKHGWFQRLMKAMNSLGLSVTEANVLTMEHKVMAILKAEAKLHGCQAEQLKGAVSKLMQDGLPLDQV